MCQKALAHTGARTLRVASLINQPLMAKVCEMIASVDYIREKTALLHPLTYICIRLYIYIAYVRVYRCAGAKGEREDRKPAPARMITRLARE